MKLAELDSPLIELPWVNETYSGFIVSQPPYSDTPALEDWHYGDGANFNLCEQRLVWFLTRTGIETYGHVLPKRTQKSAEWEVCGLCHEVDRQGCVVPSDCPRSYGNPLCGHADNALVYPGLESLLHILLIGWLLEEDDFIQHSAWLRIIAHKLYLMDVIAKWNSCITVPNCEDDKYFHLFGVKADETSYAPDIPAKLARNRQWQSQIRQQVNPYIDYLVSKIRQKMLLDWQVQSWPHVTERVSLEIHKIIENRFPDFWSKSFPM